MTKSCICWLTTGLLMLLTIWGIPAQAQQLIKPTGRTQTVNGTKYYYHIVQDGQTVYSIARAYGLHYSNAVVKTDIHSLNVGDTVWLPYTSQSSAAVMKAIGTTQVEDPTITITVAPKQTLYSLAKEYGTTVEKLTELNPEVQTTGLKAGQQLRVPKSQGSTSTTRPTPTQPSAPVKRPTTPTTPTTHQPPAQQVEHSAASSATIRERRQADRVTVSLILPLYLARIDEISTSKFDVEQRGRKDYKSFEFIQFYEGILMGIDALEQMGVNITLNVVDMPSSGAEDIIASYNQHNVGASDCIIALLQKDAFSTVASLAAKDNVFIVNPMATRPEIVTNNPYVVKYMPSTAGTVRAILDEISRSYPGSELFVVHSGARAESETLKELQRQLPSYSIKYTLFNWSVAAKLSNTLKASKNPVVLAIYDQGRDKNRIFATQLLNRLASAKSSHPTLFTMTNYMKELSDVDYSMLQQTDYHFPYPTYLDYNNTRHKDFVDAFRQRFKTEPTNDYAAVAHDLILYIGAAINSRGTDFWKDANAVRPQSMLFPIRLTRDATNNGYENQATALYMMQDYKLIPVNTR